MIQEDIDTLCCCEFIDQKKNRSHILACCCDCVDFDEGFESYITGRGIPNNKFQAFMATIQDRLRIPWRGGAKQIAIDSLLPILILPSIFLIAAQSLWWTIFSFSLVTFFLLYIFKFLISTIPRTKFFFSWTIISIILLYIIFEFVVIPLLEILLHENIGLSCLISAFLYCLYALKIRATQLHKYENQESEAFSRPGSRYYNCGICQTTVPDKDHHCLWFDCCIGRHNQCLFILSLFFASASLLYSSNLTLTSVCHPFVFYKTILLPDDCSEVYEQFDLGVSFVSAVYSIVLAVIILVLLVQQIILVSVGLTTKEWRQLTLFQKCLLGLTARKPYNRGFFKNWKRIICTSESKYGLVSET